MKVTFDQLPRVQRHLFAAGLGGAAVVFGGLFHSLLALPLLGAMLLCLLVRHSVVFDLETRTYRAQHMFSSYGGTFADLKGIVLERGMVLSTSALGHYQSPSQYDPHYTVTLVWIAPSGTPYVLASMSKFEDALEYARDACGRFSLPLIEGPKLKAYRKEVEKAHRDLAKL